MEIWAVTDRKKIETPNIDKLAANGIKFTQHQNKYLTVTDRSMIPRWRNPEISGVSRASFGTKDKITIRLYNQSFHTPVSCLVSE